MDSATFKESGMYNHKDIQKILECQRSKAYTIIQELNKEREEEGLITVPGRIPAEDFNKKFYRGYNDARI